MRLHRYFFSAHCLFSWCFLVFLIISVSATSSSPLKTPKLSWSLSTVLQDPDEKKVVAAASVSNELKTFFYNQTLDHFNYNPQSYATFQQRYVINEKHWGGPNTTAPIFAYLGAEAPIDSDLSVIGFLPDNAPRFKALLVYIEHRFYGQSVPFGTFQEALKNESLRGYFNSAQAIADYAEVLLFLKKKYCAENSPIIVVGGSYGGMLASWFRLKYPHIALGALASSAPILYFDNITPENGYYSIVTKDFKEASESCHNTIKKSWAEINRVASQSNGLTTLSKKFKTCNKLNVSSELKDYLETIYASAAQYNSPPNYPVTEICGGIDGAPKGSNVLERIFSGVAAYRGNRTCYDTHEFNVPTQTSLGYGWQACSEMVFPIGKDSKTMFEPVPFNLESYVEDCKKYYGVPPRPHWATTYYGGHNIKLVLGRFASNIIFSNGLRDPYSSGGVLENISESVVAVSTVNGSHCLDIVQSRQSDPQWLIHQRKTEVKIIQGWITQYYADLHNTNTRHHYI